MILTSEQLGPPWWLRWCFDRDPGAACREAHSRGRQRDVLWPQL